MPPETVLNAQQEAQVLDLAKAIITDAEAAGVRSLSGLLGLTYGRLRQAPAEQRPMLAAAYRTILASATTQRSAT